MKDIKQILEALDLQAMNPATSSGGRWSRSSRRRRSSNRAARRRGELIAKVQATTAADYEKLVARRARRLRGVARGAGAEARRNRAPHGRGAARAQGRARQPRLARDGQDPGRGRGRSAGDDRHRRLRRRPVAHALRPDDALASGPHHRMYEQWHPLGVVGIITAFNFPGRGVGVERDASRPSAATPCIWKPSPQDAADCAIAVQHICDRVLGATRPAGDLLRWSSAPTTRSASASSTTGASPLIVVHGLDARSAARSRKRVARAPRPHAPRARRQQRDHRRWTTRTSTSRCRAVLFGAVGTAGQRCTTTRRLLVHEKHRRRRSRERLVHAYKQVRIGDPLDAGDADGAADRRRRGRAL